jgi:hypothetical protein
MRQPNLGQQAIQPRGHPPGARAEQTQDDRLKQQAASVPRAGVTIAFAMNFQDDPSPLIFPVVKTLAATHR